MCAGVPRGTDLLCRTEFTGVCVCLCVCVCVRERERDRKYVRAGVSRETVLLRRIEFFWCL